MATAFVRKWIFLGFIVLANLFIALKTGIGFFYFSFWFLLSVVFIDWLWLFAVYFTSGLRIEHKVPIRAVEEQLIKVETVIKNSGFLPLWNLVLEDNLACEAEGKRLKRTGLEYIASNSSRLIIYQCECYKRGRYDIGPCVVYFFDPLNIFFLKQAFPVHSELYVYPKVFRVQKFPPLTKGSVPWFGIDTSRTSGDDDEFFGIREYQPGDPIKRIHWISSARQNKLIVKQFQRQSFFRATLVFNLNRNENFGYGKETVEEYIIKIAASVAKYLLEKGCALELIAHTGEMVHIPSNKGPEHLEGIFKFLAGACAESTITLSEVLEGSSRFIPNDSNLIVITLDTEWENLMRAVPLQSRNISVIPLILLSSTFLYSFGTDKFLTDVKIKLSDTLKLSPLFFLKGENLEESFLKY